MDAVLSVSALLLQLALVVGVLGPVLGVFAYGCMEVFKAELDKQVDLHKKALNYELECHKEALELQVAAHLQIVHEMLQESTERQLKRYDAYVKMSDLAPRITQALEARALLTLCVASQDKHELHATVAQWQFANTRQELSMQHEQLLEWLRNTHDYLGSTSSYAMVQQYAALLRQYLTELQKIHCAMVDNDDQWLMRICQTLVTLESSLQTAGDYIRTDLRTLFE